jgi:excisionase family DNA binding protein
MSLPDKKAKSQRFDSVSNPSGTRTVHKTVWTLRKGPNVKKKFVITSSAASTPSAPCSIATMIERHAVMLTVDDLARLLSFKPKTIYAKVAKGTLPATRMDGTIRFDPHTTAEWLRSKSA